MNEQMEMDLQNNLDDDESKIPEIKLEVTDCQYCGDSGLCTFCERGRKEIVNHESTNKNQKNKRN